LSVKKYQICIKNQGDLAEALCQASRCRIFCRHIILPHYFIDTPARSDYTPAGQKQHLINPSKNISCVFPVRRNYSGESSPPHAALSPLVVHFVAGQGMTGNFLEALNSRKWLRDFSESIRAFHPSSTFKTVLS
jgi:hypothetical protein